ncbi:hypothetical protein BAUCODRAFT_122033 [Baudoinia panamericana UAMH 10762]|uniref:Disease resistance R13L4/SHOC-2-like LRR domain-containing protein n=1 Tax=Baudoinia panamericana (strain UAMH 10762) TaxID=717646 RepID=M2NF52_BAUPA|nr:uncharacterized protein BAUCODRAFT_122033 [Baudoinia panamericana UAMH 10762]EMC97600.1 hypothetical protein BAUCODRAFT_122033 [Baudoinia panamericana UAMH 10762]
MASENAIYGEPFPVTVAELLAYTRKDLNDQAKQQGEVSAEGLEGGVHTGVTVDLSHKNIHALPVEVIDLIKDKVERLALSHNVQIAIPTQIVQCGRLRYLNLRGNQLRHFPEAVLQLAHLEILDLSKNKLVSIPEDIRSMTSLKFLAVARNKIARLPLALGEMPSLHKLKFHDNPIEYPPLDALTRNYDDTTSNIDAETERDVCQQVKRFLKAAALRERLKADSQENLSESNVETPRPPKRTLTVGRFPVRPNVSGMESMESPMSKSPSGAPPIPLRSHARNQSSNPPTSRRPVITPLLTADHEVSRSRSETVSSSASGSLRARRQGLIAPRKPTLDISSSDQASSAASVRASQASTIRAAHSRANSSVSTLNGFLYPSSSGETSSGAVSPIDGSMSRYGAVRRLSSLPENRNSKLQSGNGVRAAKRLLFSLFQLHGPIGEVTRAIKDGTPKRTMLERQLFSANALVEELDRLLNRADINCEEEDKNDEAAVSGILSTSIAALKAYGLVVKELRQHTQRVISLTESVYVRYLMSQVYMTMVESRNICSMLGFKLRSPASKSTPRTSRAWSSRTVTPTQPKPLNSRRMRGATILQSISSNASLRSMALPMPLSANGSRTNTMTSLSSFGSTNISRNESFTSLASSTLPSRSNTMRSVFDYGENDEQFDHIYLKLQSACDLARKSLPHCRTEFVTRKESADTAGQPRAAHHWALAISKCDAVIAANTLLHNRLKVVKVKDPGVRNQKDFWQLCDAFVQSWTDLATEIKDIAQQRIDITTVKTVMRPVQKAVKEVSKTISESPLYHQAVRQAGGTTSTTNGLVPPFPANINTAYAQAAGQTNGLHSGYVTPVPATPLSAALGPAVQATVASTPPANLGPPSEYFQNAAAPAGYVPNGRVVHERVDTMMQPTPFGRR